VPGGTPVLERYVLERVGIHYFVMAVLGTTRCTLSDGD
jgi:hypothetical protein